MINDLFELINNRPPIGAPVIKVITQIYENSSLAKKISNYIDPKSTHAFSIITLWPQHFWIFTNFIVFSV